MHPALRTAAWRTEGLASFRSRARGPRSLADRRLSLPKGSETVRSIELGQTEVERKHFYVVAGWHWRSLHRKVPHTMCMEALRRQNQAPTRNALALEKNGMFQVMKTSTCRLDITPKNKTVCLVSTH